MECPTCGGELKLGVAPDHVDRHVPDGTDYHLVFDAVPSLICTQCGEVLRDIEIVELMGQAVQALDAISRKLSAFEYKLPEVESQRA
jgi:hypothetical protein